MLQTLVRGFERCVDARSAARLAQPEFGRALHVPARRAGQEMPLASAGLRVLANESSSVHDCILAAGADLDALNRSHRAALADDGYGARLDAVRSGFLSSLGTSETECDPALAHSFAVADVQAEVAKRSWRLGWIVIALGAVLAASSSLLRLLSDEYGELIETLEGPNIARRRQSQELQATWGQRLLVGGLVCALVGIGLIVGGVAKNALPMLALIIAMKLLTDTGADWLSFNGKMAHAENLRQAAHLRAVYRRADLALRAIERDGGDPADLLAALGKEILDENANWLRLYLERRIEWHGK
ncbi:MAG: hypothetical protein V4693_08255 [Pseudomonadota bacterium]